jgi:hypothetical protein
MTLQAEHVKVDALRYKKDKSVGHPKQQRLVGLKNWKHSV